MEVRKRYPVQFKTLAAQKLPSVMRAVGWMLAIGVIAAGLFLYYTPWVQTTSGSQARVR